MFVLPTPPPAIVEAAKLATPHAIEQDLLLAISYVESKWDSEAIGAQGELGALQLHPRFHNISHLSEKQRFVYALGYLHAIRDLGQCGTMQDLLDCYNRGPKKVLDKPGRKVYSKAVLEALSALQDRRTHKPH